MKNRSQALKRIIQNIVIRVIGLLVYSSSAYSLCSDWFLINKVSDYDGIQIVREIGENRGALPAVFAKAIVDYKANLIRSEVEEAVEGDQYFTMGRAPLLSFLTRNESYLFDTEVVDFGAGTGLIAMASLTLADRVHAIEIDPMSLVALDFLKLQYGERLNVLSLDLKRSLNYLARLNIELRSRGKDLAIIANPPYFAIREILFTAEVLGIKKVILYGPIRLRGLFEEFGMSLIGTLDADAFYPEAPTYRGLGQTEVTDNHGVFCKGPGY